MAARTCDFETWDGCREDPTAWYCGLPAGHAGEHGKFRTNDEFCLGCAAIVHPLEVFPGSLCMTCYAKTQEDAPMPTADEIVAMWGGPVRRK